MKKFILNTLTMIVSILILSGCGRKSILSGNEEKRTGDFYVKCVIYDIKEVKKNDSKNRKLFAIKTDCGNSIIRSSNSFRKGDTVIIRN